MAGGGGRRRVRAEDRAVSAKSAGRGTRIKINIKRWGELELAFADPRAVTPSQVGTTAAETKGWHES